MEPITIAKLTPDQMREMIKAMLDNTSVWQFKKDNTIKYLHPTQKPVELAIHAICNSTQEGDVVFDPFAGSGSTLLACERMDRRCRTIEIDPKYAAVTLQRWADATGKMPKLEK